MRAKTPCRRAPYTWVSGPIKAPQTRQPWPSWKGCTANVFGTAGFGGSDEYFAKILRSVEDAVAQDNTIAGSFICQGKMPETVRARYVKMQQDGSMPNADELIANFDRALAHPDQRDVEELRNAVARAAI